MKVTVHNSIDELRHLAPAWDDLWQRSACAWPTMTAAPLAHCLDTFFPNRPVQIIAVEDDGQLVAALPLVGDRIGRMLPIYRLPDSDWCSIGDLLLDRSWESRLTNNEPLDRLVRTLRSQWQPAVFCDAVDNASPRWQAFIAAAERAGMQTARSRRGTTGLVDIAGEWPEYVSTRSRNHRRHIRVMHTRAEKEGHVALKVVTAPAASEIKTLLLRGFEVEDRSWKGADGTSVLKTPGAFAYFFEQAKLLAARGQLLVAFAELNGQPIAFEYGWLAKGVFHSAKVGYDSSFEQVSPGQLLRSLLMQQFFAERDVKLVDYLGPLADATEKWITRSYHVDRLLLTHGPLGRMIHHRFTRRHPAPVEEIDEIDDSSVERRRFEPAGSSADHRASLEL